MIVRMTNFRVNVTNDTPLEKLAAKRLGVPADIVEKVEIIRQSVDARKEANIVFAYTLQVVLGKSGEKYISKWADNENVKLIEPVKEVPVVYGAVPLKHRPVVVGFGPAGMLAALLLAEHGYCPLVLERGRDVDQRARDVERFWQTGALDPISNVQFGEGGAGTFSDGKLTTRVQDPGMALILNYLVEAGAPEEIRYQYKAHIGTDVLRQVVKNIRQRILDKGGEIRFESQMTDLVLEQDRLVGVMINSSEKIPCEILLMGIGHSARDTYRMLYGKQMAMESKAFAIGVRVEHPQEWIDRAQYGKMAGHPNLGAADYALSYQDKITGRSAYSFCMCPGGLVIGAASEEGGVAVNGMSHHSRSSGRANSALVVNVSPEDWGSDVLGGIEFQRRYEALAFQAGGKNYHAPAQRLEDFLAGEKGQLTKTSVVPTYMPGITAANLHECLPDYVARTLVHCFSDFGRKIKDFDHPDTLLTGVETRTSAPVRLLRGEDRVSLNMSGIYPIGEGAGYAGGIMSAAIDGMNGALSVIRQYQPMKRI